MSSIDREMRRPNSREPGRLPGKSFHALAQPHYRYDSGVEAEQALYKVDGAPGRADIFLVVNERYRYAGLSEVKNTDWEAVAGRGTLPRMVARHARQLWSYLNGTVELRREDGSRKRLRIREIDCSAAMVYPRAPEASVRQQVEDGLGAYGITVIWLDEPPPEHSEAFEAWRAVLARAA